MSLPEFLPGILSDALWQALLASAPYHLALVSNDGRIFFSNHRAETALDPENTLDHLVSELAPANTQAMMAAINRALADSQNQRLEVPSRLDGKTRWLDVLITPISGPARQAIGAVIVGHDITEAKQAAIELRMSINALHRLVEQQEQVSADLHDGILQSLYGVGLRLEAARASAQNGAAAMEPHLLRAVGQLNETMAEIRRFITADRPVALPPNWEEALAGTLRGLEIEGGPHLELDVDRTAAARVPTEFRSELMFIAREAVSNAMRHSGSKQVTVRLANEAACVRLEIIDDGRGFRPERFETGLGLLTMVRRAGQIGAVLTRESAEGQGTTVRLALQVSNKAEAR